ncbi:unnamed protein product [Oppiella nova]|uniref:Peroxidase n=1 Tax=Oppiella nova TaxID=334625 RepID=A0A7R9QUI7_9ACAR|nr:unnamed protein product [Oppiella nova]CAG2174860.1 unnamed protein product [Oppiella nova]
MEWGQVVAHDSVKTLQYFGGNLDPFCCPPPAPHPECGLYIPAPPDMTCLTISRSTACNTCRLGARDQMTATPSFLDLSMVYGFTDERAHSIRTFSGGKLQTNKSLVGTVILPEAVLPQDLDIYDLVNTCHLQVDRLWLPCFRAGDGIRTNQQPLIAAMITVLVVRHNQHCDGLAKVNPHWDDETLYQESRHLLIAEYNYINFKEYLPSILNEKLYDFFDLNVKPYGKYSKYNAKVNPSVIQEYGIAAFRYSHANINNNFPILDKNVFKISQMQLKFNFNQMTELWDGNKNGLIKGMCEDRQKNTDLTYLSDIRNHLFLSQQRFSATDLFVKDIFRGRDHGLASYVYYVQYCTGIHIKGWKDLHHLIPIHIVKQLMEIYTDIDLIIGGLAETLMDGSVVGPTFACILGIQFYHLKYGDRSAG